VFTSAAKAPDYKGALPAAGIWGVIDLDSPKLSRFGAMEEEYVGRIARALGAFISSVSGSLLS
jgi:hypothetical protein